MRDVPGNTGQLATLLIHLCFIVLYCALLCFYHCILRIGVLIYTVPQLQECLMSLLTYLLKVV